MGLNPYAVPRFDIADFPSHFESATQELIREAHRVTEKSIIGWAEQSGLTVNEWLCCYEPVLEIVTDEPVGSAEYVVRFRVMAKVRE